MAKSKNASKKNNRSAAAAGKLKQGPNDSGLRMAAIAAFAAVLAAICFGSSIMSMGDGSDSISNDNIFAPRKLNDMGIGSHGMSEEEIRRRAADFPCKNTFTTPDDCHRFASMGHCSLAPGWMAMFCAASCDFCHLQDPKVRCDSERIGYDNPNIWGPGAVDKLFKSLPGRFPEFNVTFMSTPETFGPWVAHFDNFLSDDEVQTLIDATDGNLKRSTDQGSFDENGLQSQVKSTSRTSENAWCMGECEKNPTVQRIVSRIESITGVPRYNYESIQLLRYQINQEYQRHHDMSMAENELLTGPRILTLFIYLSDVEEGGGTSFTDLKPPLTVAPKKSTAILWPSVMDDDPTKIDTRTYHAGLPVKKGVKLAANVWVHLRNYRAPNLHGCTGAFS